MEERRRPSNLGKRKATGSPVDEGDETSDLQRAVKKLIRQAQLEADSPNQSMSSNNTPTPGNSGPQGWSPSKTGREMDMRIFSDTARDRPVFDAYPMPTAQPAAEVQGGMVNPSNGLQIPTQQTHSGNSPFTFPVDPTNTTFPPFDPRAFGSTQQPQLDPAVESILTSYFPQPQTSSNTAGSAMVPQVPDDFLSKVFNFGWDSSGVGNGQAQNQGQQEQGMQQGQGQPQNGNNAGMGMDAMGMTNGLFDGWSAHGWMA